MGSDDLYFRDVMVHFGSSCTVHAVELIPDHFDYEFTSRAAIGVGQDRELLAILLGAISDDAGVALLAHAGGAIAAISDQSTVTGSPVART